MRNLFIIIILLPFIFTGCNKDNNNNNIPSGYHLQIGNTSGTIFYSNLQMPDSTFNDEQHITTREVSLDGDSIAEFYIISEFDSIDNEIVFRSLRIQKNLDFDGKIKTTLNSNLEFLSPSYFADGEVVIINEWLYQIDQVVYLAQVTDNYITDEQEFLGVWNSAIQMNFIIQMDKEDKSYVSWIKVSVVDFDKYIFYNYATFEM